jgi:hypothetical protein
MKAILSALAAPLAISDYADLLTSILLSTDSKGRFLIHGDTPGPLDEANVIHVKNFSTDLDLVSVEAYDVSRSGSRFKVFRAGSVADDDNIATLASGSAKTFADFGSFVEAFLEGKYVVEDVPSSPGTPQPSKTTVAAVTQTEVTPGVFVIAHSDSEIRVLDSSLNIVSTISAMDGDDVSALETEITNAGYQFEWESGTLVLLGIPTDHEVQTDSASYNPVAQPNIGATTAKAANGLLLDQVNGDVAIVDVLQYTGTDPVADSASIVATLDRSPSGDGDLFE